MQMTVDMPIVSHCSVTECVYNIDMGCHARAITVGNLSDPDCDTFVASMTHTGKAQLLAGVGACKVVDCKYNDDFECVAPSIQVGHQSNHVHCLTFFPRR